MSANTTIQEGGKGYPFGPVKCLMVEGDNGEFYPWYPEADRALSSLSVDKNGIYRASDRGVYGWNRVSVNVTQADRVTGRDPETGEEKTVKVNPETGELVETVVLVEIRVTTLPTKTEYNDGETIDYSGIVVHAYSSTGQDMGEVPFNELVFPVTTAHNESGRNYATSDLDTDAFTQPIPLSNSGMYVISDDDYIREKYTFMPINGAMMVILNNDTMYTELLIASKNQDITLLYEYEYTNDRTGEQRRRYTRYSTPDSYTVDGKTVYYGIHTDGHTHPGKYGEAEPIVDSYGTSMDIFARAAAWTAIYGTVIGEDQSIPVQWPRPGDGAILETTFDILVGQRSGQGDD